jgi:hypothetical protein
MLRRNRNTRRLLHQTAPAEILTFWQARFATLFRKLTQTPTAEDAWFWKVQCHIIHYLLHRYGDTEMRLPADSQQQIAPVESPPGSRPASLEVKPSNSFTAFLGTGKMPRASDQIGPVLHKIVQVNQERYELLKTIREEMAQALRIERAISRSAVEGYRLGQLTRNAIRSRVNDSREKLGMSEPEIMALTDNEIEQLLDKIIAMDSPTAGEDASVHKASDNAAS